MCDKLWAVFCNVYEHSVPACYLERMCHQYCYFKRSESACWIRRQNSVCASEVSLAFCASADNSFSFFSVGYNSWMNVEKFIPRCVKCLVRKTVQNVLNTQTLSYRGCCLSDTPVLRWLTAHQDRLNSSSPCNSRSEPAYSRGGTGSGPPIGSHSCSGRCCLSGGTAGRGEERRGYSSWKGHHPAGNGHPRYSGSD